MKINNFLLFTFLLPINISPEELISTPTFHSSDTNILFEKSNMDTKISLNYSLKWDFNELKKFYLLPVSVYQNITEIDIRKNVKFKYYGIKISPLKLLIKPASNTKILAQENPNKNKGLISEKKIVNLSPLYDDIKENFDDWFINKSMSKVTDKWNTIEKKDKKEFIDDLLKINIWQYPILNTISQPLKEFSSEKKN